MILTLKEWNVRAWLLQKRIYFGWKKPNKHKDQFKLGNIIMKGDTIFGMYTEEMEGNKLGFYMFEAPKRMWVLDLDTGMLCLKKEG